MVDQTIHLKPENVIEIAKDTLKPAGWRCEWILSPNTHCSIILGSWNTYFKHLLRHAQYECKKTGKYICHLPRCSLPTGANPSFQHLSDHIESSHMSRASLYCPFRGCEAVVFSRGASQLDNHFKERHPDLLNKVITIPSDVVLPLSVPYFPFPHDPPSLPSHPILGCLIVPAVRGTRIRHIEGPPLSQVSQTSQTSRRKRLKLHQMVEEEDTSSESSIFFDDLERQLDKNGQFNETIGCILRMVTKPRFDVSRPQPILDPTQFSLKPPPKSFQYDVFSDRFDEMVREATLKVNAPISPQASNRTHRAQTAGTRDPEG